MIFPAHDILQQKCFVSLRNSFSAGVPPRTLAAWELTTLIYPLSRLRCLVFCATHLELWGKTYFKDLRVRRLWMDNKA